MRNTKIYSSGIFSEDSALYKWWLLAVMMLGTFMAVLDSTIVNVALPTIVRHFDGTLELGQWVVSGYLISMAVMLLCSHWFAERYGYKIIYLIGIVIFTFGSWLCSVASSLEFLIGARFLEGIGSGMVQPLALTMVLREFSGSKRGLALGFWAMASGAAVSLGPFLGGYLIQDSSWSSIFLINVPVGIFSILAISLVLREFKGLSKVKLDIVGFGLILVWIPLFLYSLVKIGNGGDLGYSVIMLAVSLIFMVWFVVYELRVKEPLLNLRLFKSRSFLIAILITFFYGVALMGGNYILPQYLQKSLGYSVFESGLVFLPVGIIQMIVAPISGALIKKIGDYKLIFAGLLIVLSYFLISVGFGDDTPKWLIMLSLYLRGLGIGLSFTALNHLSFSDIKGEQTGDASAISNTVRQFSGSVGVALLTTVLLVNYQGNSHIGSSIGFIKGVNIDFILMSLTIFMAIIALLFLKKRKNS